MADKKYTVEVDLTLGPQSKTKIEKDIADVKKQAATTVDLGPLPASTTSAWKDEYEKVQKEIDKLAATQRRVWEAGQEGVSGYTKQMEALDRQLESTVLKMENAEATARELEQTSVKLRRFSREAFEAGAIISIGLYEFANKYVEKAKEATETTIRWKRAQEDIDKSSQRVGAVLAHELLPFLQSAAKVIEKAASFVESHPEAIAAGVKLGAVLIGVSLIAKAAATGISLKADLATITAAALRKQAADIDKQSSLIFLEAAQINAGAASKSVAGSGASGLGKLGLGGLGKLGLGALGAALLDVVVLLGSFAGGLIIGDKLFDKLEGHDAKLQDYTTWIKQAIAVDAKKLGDFFGKDADWSLRSGQQAGPKDLGNTWFQKISESLGLLKRKADDAASAVDDIDLGSVENSPARDQILNAYESYLNDEQQALTKFNSDKTKINQDAFNDELHANQEYARDVQKVNEGLANSLSKLAADFARSNIEADKKYNEEKDNIIKDQADDLAKAREQLQERLRKMALEEKDKESELIAQRDALGLVKAQRKYQQDKSEAIREANLESKERREQTKKRLEELAQSYEEEKAQRAVDYANKVAEQKQEAADRLKQLQEEHTAELIRIRQLRIEKLKELDAEFKAERDRRIQYFLAQIRDLDAQLLGERQTRANHQAQMIRDLDAWFATYRSHWSAGLNSLASQTPTSDSGGYVSKGLYRMAWDNKKEFVMSGPTTAAAERALGTSLTQANLMGALQMATSNQELNYYDQRRMEVPMSKENKRAYEEGARAALQKILRS